MDKFGLSLSSIHNWLWAELDNLGIDSAIYSRHILDLFISSKYSTDYYLAKKEKSIFELVVSTSRKRKHKYSRRSNSFSNTSGEEIAWKKQIAISCLKSAVDSSLGNGTMKSIHRLVDEIYAKLTDLRLTPDSTQKEAGGSNEDNPSKVKSGKKTKENYDQAFPSLSPTNIEKSQNSNIESNGLWPKLSKLNKTPLKTLTNLQQPTKLNPTKSSFYSNRKFDSKRPSKRSSSHASNSKSFKERSYGHTRQNPYQYSKYNRKLSNAESTSSSNAQHSKGKRTRHRKGKGAGRIQKKTKEDFRFVGADHWKQNVEELGYVYSDSLENLPQSQNVSSHAVNNKTVSSKWFRDPVTGLLTFEPSYQIANFSDNCEGLDCRNMENWMWCPSPSFWSDDSLKSEKESSLTSRLYSVYQNNNEHGLTTLDQLTGKFWQDYQGIFLNLENGSQCEQEDAEDDGLLNDVFAQDFKDDSSNNSPTDYLVVGFSIGLNILSDSENSRNSSVSDPLVEQKSKFANFFKNSSGLFGENKVADEPWKNDNISIWSSRKEDQLEFDGVNGEFSEQILDLLLNPGNMSLIQNDINTCLHSGYFDSRFQVYPDPRSCFMHDNSNHFNLEMDPHDESMYRRTRSWDKLSWRRQEMSFLEAITDNDAWKTSLRISNVWQTISGIRPVVVIYNESMKTLKENAVKPNDSTHFRPIDTNDATPQNNSTDNYQAIIDNKMLANVGKHLNELSTPWLSENDYDGNQQVNPKDVNIFPTYKKHGSDKQLLTMFEKDFDIWKYDKQNLR